MAIGDHFRVAFSGLLAGQQIVSVWHYRQGSANTSANSDVKSLALGFEASVVPSIQAAVTADFTYGTIESRSFPLPPVPVVGYDEVLTDSGGVAGVSLPPSVAIVLRRRTAFLGRKYRGRMFLAGVDVATITDGVVSDVGQIALLDTLGGKLHTAFAFTAIGSPTFVPEICTILYDEPTDTYSYRATDVTGYDLDKIVRSQRRREIGRGS